MFLTLLQNYGGPIPPTPPINTADIGPGDYFSIPKKYPLKGEVKRKRLKKSEIKKIREISVSEPSREQLEELTKNLLPQASQSEIPKLADSIRERLEASLQMIMAGIDQAKTIAMIEAEQQKERERILIQSIAQYQQTMEDDEILLAYLI